MQADLVAALNEIENIIETLIKWRTDETDNEYTIVFTNAQNVYAKLVNCADIIIPKLRIASIQRYKNNVPANNALDYYKRAVWYPFIDCVVSELKSRFSNQTKLAIGSPVTINIRRCQRQI